MQHPVHAPPLLNTHHALKLLALVLMSVDHLGAFLFPECLWLRAVGRMAMPIFLFLVGHGVDYGLRRDLLLWAVGLALVSPFLGMAVLPLHILCTILAVRWVLQRMEARQVLAREPAMAIAALVLFLLPSQVVVEYGVLALLYAMLGQAVRTGRMAWRGGKGIALAACVLFLIFQMGFFPFTPWQVAYVTVTVTALTVALTRFVHRPLAVPASLRGTAVAAVWLSRHSMQYYVVHRVILQAMGVATGALSPALRWV